MYYLRCITLALILGIVVGAQAQMNEPDEFVRAKHDRSSSLPIGISFNAILNSIELLESDDPEFAMNYVAIKLGVNEDTAKTVKALLLNTHEDIKADIKSAHRDLACDSGVPKVAGDEAFAVLDQLDDVKEDVLERHLMGLYKQLDPAVAAALARWAEENKENVSYVTYDHKKHLESRGHTAGPAIAGMCILLEEQS